MANKEQWITVNGRHIKIEEGQSKKEAISKAIARSNSDSKAKQIAKNKAEADKRNRAKADVSDKKSSAKPTNHLDTLKANKSVDSEMRSLQKGGKVDLFNRPKVDAKHLVNAGWKKAGSGTATVYSSTYSSEDGKKAINLTPIKIKDGQIYILSPQQLDEYAQRLLDGEEDKDGLQIGETVEGENAKDEAGKRAERIHQLQEEYYLKRKH